MFQHHAHESACPATCLACTLYHIGCALAHSLHCCWSSHGQCMHLEGTKLGAPPWHPRVWVILQQRIVHVQTLTRSHDQGDILRCISVLPCGPPDIGCGASTVCKQMQHHTGQPACCTIGRWYHGSEGRYLCSSHLWMLTEQGNCKQALPQHFHHTWGTLQHYCTQPSWSTGTILCHNGACDTVCSKKSSARMQCAWRAKTPSMAAGGV